MLPAAADAKARHYGSKGFSCYITYQSKVLGAVGSAICAAAAS